MTSWRRLSRRKLQALFQDDEESGSDVEGVEILSEVEDEVWEPPALPQPNLRNTTDIPGSSTKWPLPGTSRRSERWESRADEDDMTFEEGWLEEEEQQQDEEEQQQDEEEAPLEGSALMHEEMDVVDPTVRLNESVARMCSSSQSDSDSEFYAESEYDYDSETDSDCYYYFDEKKSENYYCDDSESGTDSDYDAESEQGLFGGDSTALNFEWSRMKTCQGSQEPFLLETTGAVTNVSNAYDAFRIFWDDAILQHIVIETNRYAAEMASQSELFREDWIDTNVHEILILFSFWMLLGIYPMPTRNSCFTQHESLKNETFQQLFTQNRYSVLTRALHFVDNSTRTPQSSKLSSLGPVIDHLNAKFMNSYTPGQDIIIQEALTLPIENRFFKQYIKTKGAIFRVKTFELCEASTGYLWAFNVYTGKDSSAASLSNLPTTTKAVLDLVTPLLNKGHRIFMNNSFNSPILARYLKRNKTDCVGKLRTTRENFPPYLEGIPYLLDGDFCACYAGDVMVMAYQDKKMVFPISTYHGVNTVKISGLAGTPFHRKPVAIADYDMYMDRVEVRNQLLDPYLDAEKRKCVNWSRKLFKRILNDSILNSRILLHRSSGDQTEQLSFRTDLVKQIVTRHLSQVPEQQQRRISNRIQYLPVTRLVFTGKERHFIMRSSVKNDNTAGKSLISKDRQYCQWCWAREKRYRRTEFKCTTCEVYLCIDECFAMFHTIE